MNDGANFDNNDLDVVIGEPEVDCAYENFINNDIAFREDQIMENKNQNERNLVDYKHSI